MVFFFQADDCIRDLVRSRGLGDLYKRQIVDMVQKRITIDDQTPENYRALLVKDFEQEINDNFF